jgi:two-component SAPR family response regulator
MAAQNPTTKETLKVIEYQIEQIFKEVEKLNEDNLKAHTDVKNDLRFIKNNLFDPNEGIWAEVKRNSNFRNDTVKWRNALGLGVFSLVGKHIYDFFKSLS